MSFGRVIEVTCWNEQGQAYSFDGSLDVEITGSKYSGYKRPAFNIVVKNLDPLIVGDIATNNYTNIKINAGYKDENVGQIFAGTILFVNTNKVEGNTLETTFICTEGTAFISEATISETFNAGTNMYVISEYIAQQNSINYELDDQLKDISIVNDVVYDGSVYDAFSEIAANNNMVFSFTDNTVRISGVKNGDSAWVVSPNSGMVNYPKLSNDGLDVDMLLNPLIQIGNLIKMENSTFLQSDEGTAYDYLEGKRAGVQFSSDGLYFIKEIEYRLNSRDGDFKMILHCLSYQIYTSLYGGTQ